MPKLPNKMLMALVVGTLAWTWLAPKRAELVVKLLRKKRDAHSEESARLLVMDKIRGEICPLNDLCDYRPAKWEGFHRADSVTASITHHFYQDGNLRRYLFRIRRGAVSEVIDLR
jgi:hypothetical protein